MKAWSKVVAVAALVAGAATLVSTQAGAWGMGGGSGGSRGGGFHGGGFHGHGFRGPGFHQGWFRGRFFPGPFPGPGFRGGVVWWGGGGYSGDVVAGDDDPGSYDQEGFDSDEGMHFRVQEPFRGPGGDWNRRPDARGNGGSDERWNSARYEEDEADQQAARLDPWHGYQPDEW